MKAKCWQPPSFSAAFAAVTGSVWLGLLAGIGASLALSIVHGLASITFRGNQLISGVAINFIAAGMTVLIAQDWFQQGGRTPSLSGDARFGEIDLPFQATLADIPWLGPIYSELISGHSILVYVGFLTVPCDLVCPLPHAVRSCVCAPSARTRPQWTLPASRSSG